MLLCSICPADVSRSAKLGLCWTKTVRPRAEQVLTCRLCGLMPAFKDGWKDSEQLVFSGIAGRPALPGLFGLQEKHSWRENQTGSALPAARMSGKCRSRSSASCLAHLSARYSSIKRLGRRIRRFVLEVVSGMDSARVWPQTKDCKLSKAARLTCRSGSHVPFSRFKIDLQAV